jgi:hypothetical protein
VSEDAELGMAETKLIDVGVDEHPNEWVLAGAWGSHDRPSAGACTARTVRKMVSPVVSPGLKPTRHPKNGWEPEFSNFSSENGLFENP